MVSSVITLTTDFGAADGFVGAMKGVVLGINPGATIIDLTHEVPPQDVAHAAFVLATTSPYFGPEAVHVAVVDPGVGTQRRALLLITPAGRFVMPDNGLLTHMLTDTSPVAEQESSDLTCGAAVSRKIAIPKGWRAYALDRPEYWRFPVSDTFHGRDVFAPVAAHLSLGVSPDDMGTQVLEAASLDLRPPSLRGEALQGQVIFVDRFGNLVTNIRRDQLNGDSVKVDAGGASVKGLRNSYADGEGLRALIGSHGYLEIADRNRSAAQTLSLGVGATISVTS